MIVIIVTNYVLLLISYTLFQHAEIVVTEIRC